MRQMINVMKRLKRTPDVMKKAESDAKMLKRFCTDPVFIYTP